MKETTGFGFTVISKLTILPTHPSADIGRTSTVTVMGAAVPLTAENVPILPVPFNPKPISVPEGIVQLKTVFVKLDANAGKET